MKTHAILLFCTFILLGTIAQAQTRISGNVTDTNGEALIGVNVIVKETDMGTLTDNEGHFTIEIPDVSFNTVLSFSYVGFTTQEVTLKGETTLRVIMAEDQLLLNEVVVVAYGTVKRKDLTGAISTIDSKVIGVQSNSTVSRALEGAVPGLQVGSVDGQPGLDMAIRVRGLGSATQNSSNALVVIDGVPAEQANPLSSINSKDIESVTVLKDAASTALYGSRGANGVILITTKKGNKGKTQISFESRWGVNQVGSYQYDKISDPKDFYEFAWLSIYNSVRYGVDGTGMSKNYTTNVQNPNMSHDEAALFASQHLFDYTGSTTQFKRNTLGNRMLYDVPGAIYEETGMGADRSSTMKNSYLINTDGRLNPEARLLYYDKFDDYFLKSRMRQEYNISASGGTDKVDYFISLGYLEDPSYLSNSKFTRYNGRAKVNARLFDWLKVGANIGYANKSMQTLATRYGRNPGSASANPFRYINGQMQLNQMYAHDKEGNIIYENGEKKVHLQAGDTYSPLGPTSAAFASTDLLKMMDLDKDLTRSNDLNMRIYTEVRLLKDLLFTSNLSIDKFNNNRIRYWNSETGQSKGQGVYGKELAELTNLNMQQLLTYNKDVNNHHFDALIGHEFNLYTNERMMYKSSHELIPGFISSFNFVGRYIGGTFPNPFTYEDRMAMESYLARANYIYANKYYAQASLRRDGSSKFKEVKNRWGLFWSLGLGWRVSEEAFMKSTQEWLTNLKLRASYGVIGNQNGINMYSGYQTWAYSSTFTSSTAGTGTPDKLQLSQGAFVNDALTWENIHTLDLGVDLTLLDRIHVTFDYYNRDNVNAIWAQPIAFSLGQLSLQKNSAKIRNRGYEVELGFDLIKNRNMHWSVALNGTHYTTVLKAVPEGVGSEELQGNWTAGADGWSALGAGGSHAFTYLRGIDKDYYNIYSFKYAGPDGKTGLPSFYHKVTENDHKKDLYLDAPIGSDVTTTDYKTASRYEMGSALPTWIGGFSTTLQYKAFDLTAIIAYQLGGKFFSTDYGNNLYISDNLGSAISAELKDNTWTPENTNAKFPMVMYGNKYGDGSTFGSNLYSDMALFSASYLNMKNITVGFTLPNQLLSKMQISKMRFFVTGDNLFLVSSHSGVDPRMSLVGGYGVGAYAYPSMRTVSFGLNVNF